MMTKRGTTQSALTGVDLPAVQLPLSPLSPRWQRKRIRVLCIAREQLTLFPEPPEMCLPLRTLESARRWLDSGLLRTPTTSGPCRQRPDSRGFGGKP